MNSLTDHQLFCEQAFTQLRTRFDTDYKVLWSYMRGIPRPVYTETLLNEIRAHEGMVEALGGRIAHEGNMEPVRYIVWASDCPGIYSLGGDLARFKELIVAGDRPTLEGYARLCIDNIWARVRRFGAPVISIALIQGQAMGGGLEGALPADLIIAERGSKLGLPEIMFNLFPGMGAYSFLSRKVGMGIADRIVTSGKTYSAQEMYDLGIVDVVVDDGYGEQAVYDWIERNERARNALLAISAARRKVSPLTYDELIGVTDTWVDAALAVSKRDLRVMDLLITAQGRLGYEPGFQRHVGSPAFSVSLER